MTSSQRARPAVRLRMQALHVSTLQAPRCTCRASCSSCFAGWPATYSYQVGASRHLLMGSMSLVKVCVYN